MNMAGGEELKVAVFGGEPCGEAACTGTDSGSALGCLTVGACCGEDGCCLAPELGACARGDCWKVAGWKVLSGVEELRVMGGPKSASKCGLLLRMEEVGGDGTAGVAKGGAVEVTGWLRPGRSWLDGAPVY